MSHQEDLASDSNDVEEHLEDAYQALCQAHTSISKALDMPFKTSELFRELMDIFQYVEECIGNLESFESALEASE